MPASAKFADLLPRALPPLVFAAVPLAAFLAFIIQPLMGKQLLPIYGGTSGTWLGCMVFFQLSLLLGYAWAAWLVRRSPTAQALAVTALGLVASLTFHLPSADAADSASIAHVVWRLSLACLPAMVLLFSTSPLLHGWLRRRGEEVPYYLYAISNTGSLFALLLYPFVIEPRLRLSEQTFFWHGFLVVLAGLLAAAAYIIRKTARGENTAPPSARESISPLHVPVWLWLSALTCAGMLGATYHLAAEIGSNPLAWIGPFGAYLFSFMVVFAGRWRRWMTMATLAWLAVSLAGFMVTKGFTPETVDASRAWWLLSLTAAGSFLGNALLHGLRPAERFETFYLVLAAGGVLGGLASSVLIPSLLSRPAEFPLISVALLATGMIWLMRTREPGVIAVTACVLLAPVVAVGVHQAADETMGDGHVRHFRDLYGHVMVKTDDTSVVLSSDTTTHGTQLIETEDSRKRPTLYYTESSGVGRVLEELMIARPSLRVGVIGLGAGTLAAYSRSGDTYDFWDIDPKSLRIARENFTFISEAAGKTHLILRDGRKALEESDADYDLIVIDAFTGDGVPSHLLTREAFSIYFRRLSTRRGLLVIHASTRYSNLFPVIEATARTLGRSSLGVVTEISGSAEARDWDPARTEYVIVAPQESLKEISGWFPVEEDDGRVTRTLATVNAPLIRQRFIWSDDRNAAIDAFDLGRFLFPR